MAAITAARNGAKVTLLEKNRQTGKKLLVTGNGRCNFTNRNQELSNYRTDRPDLVKEALESFSVDDFSEKVIRQPEVVESFTRFRQEYEQDRDIRIEDEFGISDSAVKKQARSYKSVIKLDRNFHIYVHGNRNLLEQGEDEKGKFYKVYYEEEE